MSGRGESATHVLDAGATLDADDIAGIIAIRKLDAANRIIAHILSATVSRTRTAADHAHVARLRLQILRRAKA